MVTKAALVEQVEYYQNQAVGQDEAIKRAVRDRLD